MRWDALFDDLEAQLTAQDVAELRSEVSERTRAERATVALADRIRAHHDAELSVRVRSGAVLRGRCTDVAPEWVVLADGPVQALVPLAAVTTVSGLSRAAAPEPGAVLRRLGLRQALRALARDRAHVRVALEGAELIGTIDRVGADHLDLAEHPLGEVRRPGAVSQVTAVRIAALLAVRSSAG